jgi:hypothetical protein
VQLPHIDAHTIEVDAKPEVTWAALVDWIAQSSRDRGRARFARLLDCEPAETTGRPAEQDSTIPGFRVARSSPPHELTLEGRHRFSSYRLRFEIEPRGSGSLCTATTDAAFPGLAGQLYKTAVIRSRAHRLLMKRLIGGLAGRIEHARLSS